MERNVSRLPGVESSPGTSGPAEGARRLRVAVISDATPGRNGVGTYYDDLVRSLGKRMGDLRLFCPPADPDASSGGVRLRMPGDPTQDLFLPWIPRLWREVRAHDPHVIVTPTPGLYGLLGTLLASRVGATLCVAYHTEFPKLARLYWGDRFGFGPLFEGIVRRLDRLMFRRSGIVLVPNRELLASVRGRDVRDARIVGTPAPPDFVAEPPGPPPPEVRRVAYVGRLAPEKEVGQVLEAARSFPTLRFTVAGDGPLRDEVRAAADARGNLEFLGWVDRERVLDVLDGSDVVVLPSRHETFGTATFEAMIRRRIAVASPRCGIAEWPGLADGLFLMEEGERVAETLERLLSLAPEVRVALAERGCAVARALHRQTLDQWTDVLVELVEGARAP